ncbi:MAG: aminotransferase class III-fold pyridoxal phosphate-dependent enzyme, partial [Pseudomonadales bacterium]
QEWYDVRPDLTAMGKFIGGGFPVGALAGRADVMGVLDPLAKKVLFPHSGTFSANPVTMTAGYTALSMFDKTAVTQLNELADYARNQIREVIGIADVPACVTGRGSIFRVHMKPDAPANYRGAYVTPEEANLVRMMLDHLFDNGIIMINTCSGTLSTVITKREIDTLAEVMLGGFRKIRESRATASMS